MIAYVVWTHSWHCFIAVPAGDGLCIELNGNRGVPDALLRDIGAGVSPPDWYHAAGCCVVEVPLPDSQRINPWPAMLANCVSMVKRYLDIRAPWIVTPAQLYRHLKRRFHSER